MAGTEQLCQSIEKRISDLRQTPHMDRTGRENLAIQLGEAFLTTLRQLQQVKETNTQKADKAVADILESYNKLKGMREEE